ncbi:tetratricopeptide repeat protein [Propioniferax innocua]|uniref:Tetratricopeptide repeat protein n=1 Tax=Propioniferax innocua TaxID=1753 RepID=A0A542ZQW3_9ACTN|nr:hypothetical protein [Propioniferax innocua]TQL62639.1 hypothetical protein FB460_0423 [Propioniferax innocua]
MSFSTFDEWADWVVDGDFDTTLDAALAAGDQAAVVEVFDRAWNEFPGDPATDERLQGFVYRAMGSFQRVDAWDAATRWLPRFEQHYGVEDPSTRFHRGVLAWETGDAQEGRRILAALYDEFGPSAFGRDESYIAVAQGGERPASGEPLNVDAPQVQQIVAELQEAMDAERWDDAIGLCQRALGLLGDEREADGSMWFLAHMGDAYMDKGQWAEARDTFFRATQAPGGMENPYVQLRLGECEYELGNTRAAANGLIAARMQVPDILDEEPPRYRTFLVEQGLIS